MLKDYQLKLIRLSPAEFIHFGTTKELRELVTKTVGDDTFLDWKQVVSSNYDGQAGGDQEKTTDYCLHNAFVEAGVIIAPGAYVENSFLSEMGGSIRIECTPWNQIGKKQGLSRTKAAKRKFRG